MNIGLIAHDNKKKLMENLCIAYRHILCKHDIYDIDLIILLRDRVSPHAYESEVNSILQLCDMHNIPLATNLATAEVLLLALDRGDLDWRNVMR